MKHLPRPVCQMRFFFLALMSLLLFFYGGRGVWAKEEAKWTVLLYMCGTDLESRFSMATGNLLEMSKIFLPAGVEEKDVNVVIETGGSRKWHTKKKLGIEIPTDALGRFEFHPSTEAGDSGTFTLVEKVPLATMGSGDTLKDFLKWGSENYPAEKYCLYIWDHGGGSKTGIIQDELFDGDIMYLDELGKALEEGGVYLEVTIMDACLMANLETAQVLEGYGSYFVSSEEIVPGIGGALAGLLEELYINPDIHGLGAGRIYCDSTQERLSISGEEELGRILTLSVIDLSKLGEVSECFDEFFRLLLDAYENDPEKLEAISLSIENAYGYRLDQKGMVDLGSIFMQPSTLLSIPISLRNRMINAINRAVTYAVRGSGEAGSSGLSFCYAGGFSEEELEVYVHNCKSIPYQIWLDALFTWNLPDEVYESEKKLETLNAESEYALQVVPCEYRGLPSLYLVDEEHVQRFGRRPRVELFYEGKDGKISKLCENFALVDYDDEEENARYLLPPLLGTQPSINGIMADVEVVYSDDDFLIYNVPISIEDVIYYMRFRRGQSNAETGYEIMGIWKDDGGSGMVPRVTQTLSQMVGKKFKLLYPILDSSFYNTSKSLVLEKGVTLEETSLPEGTYYVRYHLTNLFGREYVTPMLKTVWDGENFHTDEADLFKDSSLS